MHIVTLRLVTTQPDGRQVPLMREEKTCAAPLNSATKQRLVELVMGIGMRRTGVGPWAAMSVAFCSASRQTLVFSISWSAWEAAGDDGFTLLIDHFAKIFEAALREI
jgi:hypothetical protein